MSGCDGQQQDVFCLLLSLDERFQQLQVVWWADGQELDTTDAPTLKHEEAPEGLDDFHKHEPAFRSVFISVGLPGHTWAQTAAADGPAVYKS